MKYISDDAIARLQHAMDTPDFSGTRYRILEEIGRGGMGTVYKALDTVLDRLVALKVVDDSEAAGEARIMAALEHPGIVPVHDAGKVSDGRVFYAMKFVEGSPLDVNGGALADRLRIFQKICETVAFAHSRGIIHGDLKPENIMIGSFGEVLMMDWGVADLALRGTIAGTRGYIAPERAAGKSADERADIFALGAILSDISRDASARPALVSIRKKAMTENPEDRYASALDLRAEITRYLDGEPVLAHRETLMERAARIFIRYRLWILLIAAYLIMRILLLAVLGR